MTTARIAVTHRSLSPPLPAHEPCHGAIHSLHGISPPLYHLPALLSRERNCTAMKDLSLLLFKSSISLKLKKGIKNFCTAPAPADPPAAPPDPPAAPPMTLEQMIRRLEMEEEAARRSKAEEDRRRRMSEVNSSDILRSARKALDQYPRFSVDVRETKYRSSFLGERVVWRKPGIVARLMGLEAIPVTPPPSRGGAPARRRRSAAVARREKERLLMGLQRRLRESVGSCSAAAPPEDWRRFSGFR